MKKVLFILSFGIAVTLVTGCDFLRTVVGRPTSADIAAKKMIVDKELSSKISASDTLAAAPSIDTVAARESIERADVSIRRSSQITDAVRSSLGHRYFIVVGSFSSIENARKLSTLAANKGYASSLISCKNGFTAVGLAPSDNLADIYAALARVKNESFCPSDVWVLDINR